MRVLAILFLIVSHAAAQSPPLIDTSLLDQRLSEIEQRLSDLESREPVLEPAGSRLTVADLNLVGGWRIREGFSRYGMAIDFDGNRLFVAAGGNKPNEIHEYTLPASPGSGADVLQWPLLQRSQTYQEWWDADSEAYPGSLDYRSGVLWASTRIFYDTSPDLITLEGLNLSTTEVVTREVPLLRPAFGGGFIKGAPEWLIGCGGYASGQGSVAGPTIAKVDGTVLLNQVSHGSMTFGDRSKREPNYSSASGTDNWLVLEPRQVGGELVGQWAADRIYGGGVWTNRGVFFVSRMGAGPLDYTKQSETFSADEHTSPFNAFYTYDPQTYGDPQYERWPYPLVVGHDVGPDGRIYLLCRNAWKGGLYEVDPAVYVFEISSE